MLDAEISLPCPAPELPQAPTTRGPILFLSDFPRDQERTAKRPLARGPGSLFQAILRSANVARDEHAYAYLYPDDPASLSEAERAACLTKALAFLALCNPRVVVPLGPIALKALAPQALLSAVRGTPLYAYPAGPDGPRYTLLPTFHPEHVQKVWSTYIICIGDVIRADEMKSSEIVYPKRALLVSPTIEEVEQHLNPAWLAEQGPLLSCDIETGWGQIRGISFAPCETFALYVPFVSLETVTRSYWPTLELELRAWAACKRALESPLPKLGQNFAGYDAQWLLQKAGIRVMNLCHDLRLLHAALYPELPKSLQFMSQAYSEQGSWKWWGKADTRAVERGDKRDA
jgi:uracil-DNA glycosylase